MTKRKTKFRNLKKKPNEEKARMRLEHPTYWKYIRLIEFFACLGVLAVFVGIIWLFNWALAHDPYNNVQIVDSLKVIFA